jgi:hypothetical protein
MHKDEIQLLSAVPGGTRRQPFANCPAQAPAAARALPRHELQLCGSQVLVGLSASGAIALLVWAVVKLWLFGG